MPETRLAKTRRSLPEGYQFGHAGRVVMTALRIERVESTPITSDYATDYSQRSPYTTDRDPGDETPTRRLRRREA